MNYTQNPPSPPPIIPPPFCHLIPLSNRPLSLFSTTNKKIQKLNQFNNNLPTCNCACNYNIMNKLLKKVGLNLLLNVKVKSC